MGEAAPGRAARPGQVAPGDPSVSQFREVISTTEGAAGAGQAGALRASQIDDMSNKCAAESQPYRCTAQTWDDTVRWTIERALKEPLDSSMQVTREVVTTVCI